MSDDQAEALPSGQVCALRPSAVRFLTDLDEARREVVLKCFSSRRLADREVLLAPGDLNDHLFVLVAGKLRVALNAPDAAQYVSVPVGECVGELSVIDGCPVSAYVVADGPVELLQIRGQDFWHAVRGAPEIARSLMRTLTNRIREDNRVALNALEQDMRLRQLESELMQAHAIQSNMLPARRPLLRDHPRIAVDAGIAPAHQIGGDFYDVFALDDRRVVIAIGDVSGKGMPAALFMVKCLTLLRKDLARVAAALPLDLALAEVNDELCRGNEMCMFTTLFVAVIDTHTGELTYANGGHLPPLIGRAGTGFAPLPLPVGMLLGVVEGAVYRTRRIVLGSGDRLVLFTDGVSEAESPDRQMYGTARLLDLLDGAGEAAPADLVARIQADVQAFAGEADPSDDITIVALTYLG